MRAPLRASMRASLAASTALIVGLTGCSNSSYIYQT